MRPPLKSFLLMIILSLQLNISFGLPDSSKKELTDLLIQRSILFDEYRNSLTKKSGFFGNRTKNDMAQTQEQLKSIVAQDNRIIDALNRAMDFKTFEKTAMNYDVSDYADRLKNLHIVNDTLSSQIKMLEQKSAASRSDLNFYRLCTILLFLLSAGLTYVTFKLRKRKAEKLSSN